MRVKPTAIWGMSVRRGLPDRHACPAGRWVDGPMTSPLSGHSICVSAIGALAKRYKRPTS
jgi:hypothetical protein